LQSQIKDTIH